MAPAMSGPSAFLQGMREALGRPFVLEELRSRAWASAHFRGLRHELAFRLEGDGAGDIADDFLKRLASGAPELPGGLVAGISLLSEERRPGWARLRIEALTVEPR